MPPASAGSRHGKSDEKRDEIDEKERAREKENDANEI